MKAGRSSFRTARTIRLAPIRLVTTGLATVGAAVFGIVVSAIVVLGTSTAGAQKHDAAADKKAESPYAVLAQTPEKARQKKNPFAGDAQAVAVGEKLFQQHCIECHGENAAGTRKAPSLLRDEVQTATPGTLFWILTNGVVRRGMPVWSKLPEQQRWQLVTFLQSLRPPSPDSPPGNNPR